MHNKVPNNFKVINSSLPLVQLNSLFSFYDISKKRESSKLTYNLLIFIPQFHNRILRIMADVSPRPANESQISHPLPGLTNIITGHDPSTGKSIIQEERPAQWEDPFNNKTMTSNAVYTTSNFPPDLNDDADLNTHNQLLSAPGKLGLVSPGGTVCRIVDFCPGNGGLMHRTQSLDYGVVLEGSVELVLDSGETRVMHRGDSAVQRATMHSWRNPSPTEWARMFFVLQDCQPVTVGDQALKEDLGVGSDFLPPSQNNI
jgi:Cupin domain